MLISEHSVEHVKVIGSVRPDARNLQIEIRGRDLASGTLRSLRLTGQQIHDLLERPITRIIEATKDTLARTPPQLAGDVIDRGITVTGGSPLMRGVAQRIGLETATPPHVADSARTHASRSAQPDPSSNNPPARNTPRELPSPSPPRHHTNVRAQTRRRKPRA